MAEGNASTCWDHLWVEVRAGRLGMAARGKGIQVVWPHDPLVYIGSDIAGGRQRGPLAAVRRR